MKDEKFVKDSKILVDFFTTYCHDKHKKELIDGEIELDYRGKNFGKVPYSLCEDCEDLLKYSHKRLSKCPHEDKPSCRNCKKPCYEEIRYKKMYAMMKYSGMKLGLTKVKNFIFGKRD